MFKFENKNTLIPPKRLCKKCGKCCKELKCSNLSSSNLCLIYEKKDISCEMYPCMIWSDIPEGCGYKGWIFQQREFYKRKVRNSKERLISLKILLRCANIADKVKFENEINELNVFIKSFWKYGAKDW
ncbi:MAG: hypothetical protein MJ229_02665 [bacterium]|nr:hypothetical protein [bacterium]